MTSLAGMSYCTPFDTGERRINFLRKGYSSHVRRVRTHGRRNRGSGRTAAQREFSCKGGHGAGHSYLTCPWTMVFYDQLSTRVCGCSAMRVVAAVMRPENGHLLTGSELACCARRDFP